MYMYKIKSIYQNVSCYTRRKLHLQKQNLKYLKENKL